MNAKKTKMPKVKWFPLVVMTMSICMLGGRPINYIICDSTLPEDIKCATTLTEGDTQMTEVARKHPDIIIKAATISLKRF